MRTLQLDEHLSSEKYFQSLVLLFPLNKLAMDSILTEMKYG